MQRHQHLQQTDGTSWSLNFTTSLRRPHELPAVQGAMPGCIMCDRLQSLAPAPTTTEAGPCSCTQAHCCSSGTLAFNVSFSCARQCLGVISVLPAGNAASGGAHGPSHTGHAQGCRACGCHHSSPAAASGGCLQTSIWARKAVSVLQARAVTLLPADNPGLSSGGTGACRLSLHHACPGGTRAERSSN